MVVTEDELRLRCRRMQALLAQNGLNGCLISQNVGIYYFTGSMQTGYLFIPVAGSPTYYVRRSLERALSEAGVPTAELGSFRSFGSRLASDYPELFADDMRPAVGADLDVMPTQLYLKLVEAAPAIEWRDGSALVRRVRTVKSAYELGRISAAADITAVALEAGISVLREGITELELSAAIEFSMRRQGHAGMMRMRGYNQEIMSGMVAAGETAAEPTYFDGPAGGRGLSPAAPQSASRRAIRRNEPVLIDIGCCIDGYTIDQTRTAVIGKLPDTLQAAYDLSVAIVRKTESMLRPGAVPETIYKAALAMAESNGWSNHFMGYGRDQVKFLGHGIGLEIDEWPVLAAGFREPLEEGMVIAVEPKFTFPGQGVVGIENTYVVTGDGFRPLTVSPEMLYHIDEI